MFGTLIKSVGNYLGWFSPRDIQTKRTKPRKGDYVGTVKVAPFEELPGAIRTSEKDILDIFEKNFDITQDYDSLETNLSKFNSDYANGKYSSVSKETKNYMINRLHEKRALIESANMDDTRAYDFLLDLGRAADYMERIERGKISPSKPVVEYSVGSYDENAAVPLKASA